MKTVSALFALRKVSRLVLAPGIAAMVWGATLAAQGADLLVQAYPIGQPGNQIGTLDVAVPADGKVTVSATQLVTSANYVFAYWFLETNCTIRPLTGTTNNSTVRLVCSTNEDSSLTAYFVDARPKLTIQINPPGSGCYTVPAEGTYTNNFNEIVSVTANATNGYSFASWSGASVSPSNPVSVTMDASKTLIANFGRSWTISQYYYNGALVPGPVTRILPDGTNVAVSVPVPLSADLGGYRFRCNGYANGINFAPTALVGPNQYTANITPLTNNAWLTWQWVRQYPITVNSPTNGTAVITESTAPGDNNPTDFWVDTNTTITITMTAVNPALYEPDYCLVGTNKLYPNLDGDVFPARIVGATTVRPYFRAIAAPLLPAWFVQMWGLQSGALGNGPTDDPDRDGLNNSQEAMLSNTNKGYYYNPLHADTDGDGMDDGYEFKSIDSSSNMTPEVEARYQPAATDNGSGSVDKGPGGNPDNDYLWSTGDGYRYMSRPLTNMAEYLGPDGKGPITRTLAFGDAGYPLPDNPVGKRPAVIVLLTSYADTGDTGDQSKGNTADSDKDTLDDGFEYSWDQWQQAHSASNEVILIGVTNGVGISITNTVPIWDGVANVTRVFNPKSPYVDSRDPDKDVLYDYETGKVSAHYFDAIREYNVWRADALSVGAAAPHSIRMDNPPEAVPNPQRCSHPFLWDVDRDGLPDGYEVIFGYDPWAAVTPGHLLPDGQDNPDDDWMARISLDRLSLRNHEVYATNAFDSRVAWAEFYPTRDRMVGPGTARTPTTERYGNADEMRGPDGIMAIIPVASYSGVDDATYPFNPDSDGDGIWDGWENYVGLDASLGSDAGRDIDNDRLSSLAEFQSYVTSSTNREALLPVPDWNNKLFPTDPNDKDTDGDGLVDGHEKTFFNGTSLTATNLVIDFETSLVVTQVFTVGTWNGAAYTSGGLNPTSSDTDDDTLPDPWEACYGVNPGLDGTQRDTFADPDHDRVPNYLEYYSCSVYLWQWDAWLSHTGTIYNSGDFYGGAAGGTPKLWDWSQTLYNPMLGVVGRFGYAGAVPNLVDSDDDGMDDYYEIFHGLNPAYGVIDLVLSRVFNVPFPVGVFAVQPYVADPRVMPYVNGSPFMDSDGDGLPNSAEGVCLLLPDTSPGYHTDPSPLWITDMAYPNSWVNLYYTPGSFWPWCLPPLIPGYAYDFECNEGFDTDNDGYSDREELVVTQTDPLTPERPVKRRALYLPLGQPAYARTFPGYAYNDDSLRSFTVEAWIRPINPASGTNQVVVERPILVPLGNPMYAAGVRVNFRLGLDPAGSPYVAYHGEGMEAIFYVAKASAASRVSATNWTHLCGTYQVPSATNPDQRGVLTLYVNGQMAAQTNPDELPANARFGNGPDCFRFGAPIIIGASDAFPDGDMDVTTFLIPSPDPFDFFKGWVDEVRVWDGARSQGQVVNSMMRQMKQADVIASQATTTDLLYLFSFDALPDPDHTPTAPAGLGFDVTGNYIYPADYTGVGFWATELSRSQVYAGLGGGDPRYLPWIENAVAHLPLVPPVDIGDPNVIQNVMNGTNIVGQVLPFRNTTNPYGFWHITAPSILDESAPLYNDLLPLAWAEGDDDIAMWDGGGVPAIDPFDTDGDGMPDAWEEAHGLNPRDPSGDNGPDADLDGDGLSNYYEYLCGTDPRKIISGTGNIPDGDTDADGDHLSNIQELQHGTMPNMMDTDDDGLTDWEEINGQVDTTSGWVRPPTSPAPVVSTDPLNALSPVVPRSLYLNGVDARLIVPPSDKLMSRDWTLEAWVRPEARTNCDGGVLVSRYIQGLSASEYAINYELGLETNGAISAHAVVSTNTVGTNTVVVTNVVGTLRPYVRYLVTHGGVPVETKTDGLGSYTNGLHAVTVPIGEWTHIAGVFNSVSNILSLYVNGQLASYRTDGADLPPLVYGYVASHRDDEVTIGASRSTGPVTSAFEGWVDNVRIWSAVRTAAQIADRYNAPEGIPTQHAIGTLQLKNGTIVMSSGLTAAVAALSATEPTRMLVRFSSVAVARNTTALTQAGLTVLNAVAPDVLTVKATRQQLAALGAKVTWAGLLRPADKISQKLAVDGSHAARDVLVQFFGDVSEFEAVQSVKSVGGTAFRDSFLGGKYVVATLSDAQLNSLAVDNRVAWFLPASASLTVRPVFLMDSHLGNGVEAAPFTAPSVGWDGAGRGSASLTYHFLNVTPDLSAAVAMKTVADQFTTWAAAGALTFRETASAGLSNSIDIGWFSGAHGDAADFDGTDGVLAHGFLPNDLNTEPIAGDLHFDEDELWTVGATPTSCDLQYVALHEVGHCLGLGHSDDPTAVMYPFYDGTQTAALKKDDIAGIQSIYGLPLGMGRLTEFRFDDGGKTAQDFSAQKDWLTGWASAAILDGAVFDTNTAPVLNRDSDGDGLPDWWEMAFGLDPYDALEMNSANGDPDGDGLSNAAEYQAGTDPLSADTKRNGSTDFYAWDDLHTNVLYRYRTYGELYTDHDGMDDWWEQTQGLDPRIYDSNLDPDEDGWSNLAEFQTGTDPLNGATNPVPEVTFHVKYNGLNSAGNLTIHAYSTVTMDDLPDAVYSMTGLPSTPVVGELLSASGYGSLAFRNIVPGSLVITGGTIRFRDNGLGVLTSTTAGNSGTIDYVTGGYTLIYTGTEDLLAAYRYRALATSYPLDLTFTGATSGHLREGDAWFFAFVDRNNDQTWSEDEPAGVAQYQPIDARRGTLDVEIGLTDGLPGYQRVRWTGQPGQDAYLVEIANLSMGGTAVFRTTIRAPRTYLQEQDYRNAGVYGLPFAPNFSATVFAPDGVTIVATNFFDVSYYPASVAAPECVYPSGAPLHYAQNEFQWRMDTNATAFNLVIKAGSTNNAALLNITSVPTFREADGTTRFRLPIYAGDGAFTNGVYYWQVRSLNARANSVFSDWRSFRVELDDHPQGPWSITGDVVYAGKVTNRSFRVQAYASPGLGGTPLAQSTLANTTVPTAWPLNRMHYMLKGLPAGQYYVRSFLDQNGNGKKDAWESAGFMSSNAIYQIGSVTLPTSADSQDVYVMIADTDNDKLADDWEYQYYTNLTSAGSGPLRGYTVSASSTNINVYECYAASPLNMSPVNPDIVGPDGLPLRMKDAFGLDVWSPYKFVISSMMTDETGHPTVSWPALSASGLAACGVGSSVSLASGAFTLRYQLQYTDDLVTWQDVPTRGAVMYDAGKRLFRFTDVPSSLGTSRCYRYKVMWE